MKYDALIQSYLDVLPRLDEEKAADVLAEIYRLRTLQVPQ